MKRTPANNRFICVAQGDKGFSLFELLIVLAIGAVLILAIGSAASTALDSWHHSSRRSALLEKGAFAMARMTRAAQNTRKLMLPLGDNPATPFDESQRNLLAVALDPSLDRDNDGFADADNDKDGRVDEDLPADNNNDFVSGILGIDDDGDGLIDESNAEDDDEDQDNRGTKDEDFIDGLDNDGDGTIDEDAPSDMNNDGISGVNNVDDDGDGFTDESNKEDDDEDEDNRSTKDEDWYDTVVYFVSPDGTTLIERLPDINPVDGADYTERPLVQAASIALTVQRIAPGLERGELLEITLQLTDDTGETVQLTNTLGVENSILNAQVIAGI